MLPYFSVNHFLMQVPKALVINYIGFMAGHTTKNDLVSGRIEEREEYIRLGSALQVFLIKPCNLPLKF